MELSLAKNIARFRKEAGMTQEDLAESVGVTCASVSKWERGLATPDLSVIAELAMLFGVSLDVLIGYTLLDDSIEVIVKRISTLVQRKKYDESVSECERALLKYPNDFRIVHKSGDTYFSAGLEQKNDAFLRRSIELNTHALLLMSQNTDSTVSEFSIKGSIAECYIWLGKSEKALDILKKNNVAGMFNDRIAMIYTGKEKKSLKQAEPYLMDAIGSLILSAIRTMTVFANYYAGKKDYALCREAMNWLIDMLEGLRTRDNTTFYFDKIIATYLAEMAVCSLLLGEDSIAEAQLRRAYERAELFDKAPLSGFYDIKFSVGERRVQVAYDSLEASAMASVEKQIKNDENGDAMKLWRSIKREKKNKN